MILPGQVIAEYAEQGLIGVRPRFDKQQVRPCGLRVHLSPQVLIAKPGQRVDLRGTSPEPQYDEFDLNSAPLVIPPGGFALGSTMESFKVSPSLVCWLDGRSTLARLGLLIHATASLMDGIHAEFRNIVVELANVGPFELVLPPGLAIGMVIFSTLAGEADLAFEQSQYRGQQGTIPPNLGFAIPKYRDEDER
jgi:dCTP deaminase